VSAETEARAYSKGLALGLASRIVGLLEESGLDVLGCYQVLDIVTALAGVTFRKEGTSATQEGAQPWNNLRKHPGTRSVDDGRWTETITQTERGYSPQLRHEDRAPGAGQRTQGLDCPRQFVTPHGCIYLYPSHIAGVGPEYEYGFAGSAIKVRTLFLVGGIQITVLDSPETMRALGML